MEYWNGGFKYCWWFKALIDYPAAPLTANAQFDRMKKLFRFGLKFQITNDK